MYSFVQKKHLDKEKLLNHLKIAENTNQYANYGYAVQLLESEAKKRLKISKEKAVIAVNNGTAALHTALLALKQYTGLYKIASQDFTFPSGVQGVVTDYEIVDFDYKLNFNFDQINNSHISIVTNIFGHLQDIDLIIEKAKQHKQVLIFDNAATPYSFWKNSNICNYGFASFISLHHTKPIGFGEGGLLIIDKEYEELARQTICFGKSDNKSFSRNASNFKMSEISAAAILQWWDQIDFADLASIYRKNYFNSLTQIEGGYAYPSIDKHSDTFFPSCLPVIHHESSYTSNTEIKKYYKPLKGLPVSQNLYERILCYPITQ